MVTVWRCRLEKLFENSQAQFLLVVKCVQRDYSGLAFLLKEHPRAPVNQKICRAQEQTA